METRSESFSLGFIIGLLIVVVILVAISRRRLNRYAYDERQKLAQAKAYKWAFFVLLGYLLAGSLFDLVTGIRWCDLFTFSFLGVLLSVLIFAILCIATDAYMPFTENSKRTVWILCIIGGINTVIGAANFFVPGYVIENGILTYRCVNLLCGLLLLGIAAAVLLKAQAEKRARVEEA